MTDTLKNLGALISPPDKRDIQLASIQAPVEYPEEWKADISEIVYYQNGLGSCSAHAGAHYINTFEKTEGFNKILSPRFLYALCKEDDGVEEGNQGTYLRQVFKKLKSYGICEDKYLPNDVSLPYSKYKDASIISKEAKENAQPRIINGYAMFGQNPSMEFLKEKIYRNNGLLLNIDVGNSYFSPGKAIPDNERISGHLIYAYGYDKDKIYYLDSIYKDTKLSYRWFESDYLDKIREGGTAIDVENWKVKAMTTQIDLMNKVVALMIKLVDKLKVKNKK